MVPHILKIIFYHILSTAKIGFTPRLRLVLPHVSGKELEHEHPKGINISLLRDFFPLEGYLRGHVSLGANITHEAHVVLLLPRSPEVTNLA